MGNKTSGLFAMFGLIHNKEPKLHMQKVYMEGILQILINQLFEFVCMT